MSCLRTSTRLFYESRSFGWLRVHANAVILIARENTVDANDLHGFIRRCSTQVADGALHVGHELEHFCGGRQSRRCRMNIPCKYMVQEVRIEIFILHPVNDSEHRLS